MTNFSGIAAADELDALLTRDDFEPAVQVDTVLLDDTLEALLRARAAVAALQALAGHLQAGSDDELTTVGLSVDARVAVEQLDGFVAGVLG
jgi:hypothetical protein